MSDLRAVSFDCYGTLIDVATVRASRLRKLARRAKPVDQESGEALAKRWAEIQWTLVREEWRPYRDVIVEATHRLALEKGWQWRAADGERMVELTAAAEPFAEVEEVFKQIGERGWKLAIASNTDEAIIVETLAKLPVDFDVVVTAERCRSYKPSPEPMELVLTRLGVEPESLLHVAAGYSYDIPTADALGCQTAWVNRQGIKQPGPLAPTYEWRDLLSLLEL